MESLSPNIFVHDINKTIAFYKELGFKVTMSVPEQPEYVWVMMTNDKVTIMFQTFESLGKDLTEISRTDTSGPMLFYINVKDIQGFFKKIENKALVLKGLEKTFYGATEFTIKDCNGLILTFAEHENNA